MRSSLWPVAIAKLEADAKSIDAKSIDAEEAAKQKEEEATTLSEADGSKGSGDSAKGSQGSKGSKGSGGSAKGSKGSKGSGGRKVTSSYITCAHPLPLIIEAHLRLLTV